MKPETIVVTSILVILTMTVPRKWILLPFVMAACIVPPDQRIIIFSLDFTTIRFCIFFAVLRLYLFNEIRMIKWNSFDKLFLAWVVCGAIIYVIQQGNIKGVINKRCAPINNLLPFPLDLWGCPIYKVPSTVWLRSGNNGDGEFAPPHSQGDRLFHHRAREISVGLPKN